MPVLLLWKRSCFSSEEKDAPPTRVVSMNCSMVYCLTTRRETFGGLFGVTYFDCASAAPASAVRVRSAASARRSAARGKLFSVMVRVLCGVCRSGLALRDEDDHVAVRAAFPEAARQTRHLLVARAREHAQ